MNGLIDLVKKSLNDDFSDQSNGNIVNKVFYTEYLIDMHLVLSMRRMIDENDTDTVYDEKNVLKFDTILGLLLNEFSELYRKAQIIIEDYYDSLSKLEQNKLSVFLDYDHHFMIDCESLSSVFSFSENRNLKFLDNSIINRIFNTDKDLFKYVKKAYYLLKVLFNTFNITVDNSLKPHFNSDLNSKLNRQQIDNIAFYLSLTKETFVKFYNEFSNIFVDEVNNKVSKVWLSNDAINEFDSLKKYINEKHRGKYGTNCKTAEKCFSIMNVGSYNFFSLSGNDLNYDANDNANIVNQINKNVFNRKYIYGNISNNTKRYVTLKQTDNVYEVLNSPIQFLNDNEVKKCKIDRTDEVGDAYGCCERKMLSSYENCNNTLDSSNDVYKFFIKYLPCQKCQPALRNLNCKIYALFINYSDMINKLSSDRPLKIREGSKVEFYTLN